MAAVSRGDDMLRRTVAGPTQSIRDGERAQLGDPEVATGPRPTNRPAALQLSGLVIGGRYRLIAEIGRGGMGCVWRAEHLAWEAPVAVKLMNRDVTDQPEARARFEREVRLAAGLRSPHVVQVLDHGIDEATRIPFITMELLEGESLQQRLRRLERLTPAETFGVVTQLVRALSRAHAAGIVHRDLKPDNVFLVRNDEESIVKILDFGVAKGLVPSLAGGLTRPGSVLGTPFYMSPEQLRGSREIDHRADLWSLSTIACECLTGRRPFEAEDFAQLALLLLGNSGRPLPSELGPVPPDFDAWFLRATHPDIAQRFQSARELGQTLGPVCGFAPSSQMGQTLFQEFAGEPESTAAVAHTRSHRFYPSSIWQLPSVRLVVPTLLALVLVGGAFGLWYRFGDRSAERGAARQVVPAAAPTTQTLSLTNAGAPLADPTPALPSSSEPTSAAVSAPTIQAVPTDPPPLLPAEAASQQQPAEAAPPVQRAPWAVKRPAPSAKSQPAEARRAGKTSAGGARRHTSAPAAAETEAPPVDVHGRRIRMTLDPSQ
jgi:eukaryotic-like serine/threonine-protein kinase